MSRKLSDDEGKKAPLGMRTTHALRAKMETAAAASGRSLAQEAEFRLERSFDPATEAVLSLIEGDSKSSRVIRAISQVFYAVSFEGSGVPAYIARAGLTAAFERILADTFNDPGGLMSDIFSSPDEAAQQRARDKFLSLADTILAAHRAQRVGPDAGEALSLVQQAQVLGLLPAEYDEAISVLQAAKKASSNKKFETAE